MVIPVLQHVFLSKDGKTITLKDATGAYSAGTNPGGYGVPNPAAPAVVALTARYWPDTLPYGNLVTDDAGIVANLLGSGQAFTTLSFGQLTASQFAAGVHHFKYYPLETINTVVNLTNNSLLVTVASGTTPNTWNSGYLGIVFIDPDDSSYSKVYRIDRAEAITTSQFYLEEAFEGLTKNGYTVMIAPEADLKVLVDVPAKECLVGRIGKMAEACSCNNDEINRLIYMTLQLFASQVNFNCKDYQGAHNKIVGVYLECTDCKTKCSCS